MPPRDANNPSPFDSEVDPDPATLAFFQKMFPQLPSGYPEFATDAYHNPDVGQFSYPTLNNADPTQQIQKAETYGNHQTNHLYPARKEFSPTGLDFVEAMGLYDTIKAPIVNYPISNRPRLVSQNMPDFISPGSVDSHARARAYIEALVKAIMGG